MRRAQKLKLCQQWHSQSDLCNISQKLFALLPVDAFFGAEFEIYESYEISTATCSILILFLAEKLGHLRGSFEIPPPIRLPDDNQTVQDVPGKSTLLKFTVWGNWNHFELFGSKT